MLITRSVGITLLLTGAACHHGTGSGSPGQGKGELVGDTAAFRPRIVNIDRTRQRVTFELDEPAHLVVLWVAPGETIEPVSAATGTGLTPPGKHVISAAPTTNSPTGPVPWTGVQQADYDECVRRGQKNLPKTPVVRRDSTGREITEPGTQSHDPKREFDMERRCGSMVNRYAVAKPQDASERYLVLLASNAPMLFPEIVARLREVVTVSTDDMPAAMTSIADALYVDRRAIWSGHYLRW